MSSNSSGGKFIGRLLVAILIGSLFAIAISKARHG